MPCTVCSKPANSFNYGALSCNACVMFFRRVVSGKNPVKACKNGGKCEDVKFSNCRPCRFEKCLQAGMSCARTSSSPDGSETSQNSIDNHKNQTMNYLIQNLSDLDKIRSYRLTAYLVEDHLDPSLDEIIDNPFGLKFVPRPHCVKTDTFEWAFLEQINCIDYLRSLDFTKYIEIEDLKVLVKASYFKFSLLVNAFRSMMFKQKELQNPDKNLYSLCYLKPNVCYEYTP